MWFDIIHHENSQWEVSINEGNTRISLGILDKQERNNLAQQLIETIIELGAPAKFKFEGTLTANEAKYVREWIDARLDSRTQAHGQYLQSALFQLVLARRKGDLK